MVAIMSALQPLTLGLWPRNSRSRLISFYNAMTGAFGIPPGGDYYREFADHVKTLQSKLGDKGKIAVTGHSLGGGLAHIVGALTKEAAVAFSPPGVVDARHTYDAVSEDLETCMRASRDTCTGGLTASHVKS